MEVRISIFLILDTPHVGLIPSTMGMSHGLALLLTDEAGRHRVPGNASAAYWDRCDIVFEVAGCSGLIHHFCNG